MGNATQDRPHVNTRKPGKSICFLGDDSDALRSILDYSLWFNQKLEKQRNHLKKGHYHINLKSNQDHGAMFLPVHHEALAVMRLMQDENWAERIAELHQEYGGLGTFGLQDQTVADPSEASQLHQAG